MEQAREASWNRFGRQIVFYLPGMFRCDGVSGKYPAVSITGPHCRLQCDHCRGKILAPMIHASEPEVLLRKCLELESMGNLGVLISGGCDEEGHLPWDEFIPAIREVKRETGLKVSVHSGFVDDAIAMSLEEAGVDQVLIDVIGDDETYWKVCHLESGVSRLTASLDALGKTGLAVVPHIVCGFDHGRLEGARRALDTVSKLNVELLVIISLMRLPGTPMWHAKPPPAAAVAQLVAEARLRIPDAEISLGCARQRGDSLLETLAIDSGVNRMALPSEEARSRAAHYGLKTKFQRTCCSVSENIDEPGW
jgi:hypothetical protein